VETQAAILAHLVRHSVKQRRNILLAGNYFGLGNLAEVLESSSKALQNYSAFPP